MRTELGKRAFGWLALGLALGIPVAPSAHGAARRPRRRVARPAEAGSGEASWLASIAEGIRREEYSISARREDSGFTAPSRAHGFRTTWEAGVVTVTPRESAGAWSLRLG